MKKIASPGELASELRSLLAYASGDQPSRKRIASQLQGLAQRTAAGKDLADLLKIAPDWYAARADIQRRKEKLEQEFNKEWTEAHLELEKGTEALQENIHDALVKYFGERVRESNISGSLVEVFIGPAAKVSTQIALTFEERPHMGYKLRADRGDSGSHDVDGQLSAKNTVQKLLDVVKKADNKGYWS